MDILRTYKTCYGKDLIDDIRSETSGNFENILVSLLTQTSELYARELFEAMYGEGTDEDVLIEVMCTMSNYEIREIAAMFQRMFGKNLEHELRSDTSGTFKRLMTSLSCGNRDESMVTDVNQARIDAQELKRAGGESSQHFPRKLFEISLTFFQLTNGERMKVLSIAFSA